MTAWISAAAWFWLGVSLGLSAGTLAVLAVYATLASRDLPEVEE